MDGNTVHLNAGADQVVLSVSVDTIHLFATPHKKEIRRNEKCCLALQLNWLEFIT